MATVWIRLLRWAAVPTVRDFGMLYPRPRSPWGGFSTDASGIDAPEIEIKLADMRNAMEFINLIKTAHLDESDLDEDTLERLRTPICGDIDIKDKDLLLSLEIYLGTENASRAVYENMRTAFKRDSPTRQILSHAAVRVCCLVSAIAWYLHAVLLRMWLQVEVAAKRLTGISPMKNDMCVNSCLGYTGPYKDLDQCPKCQQMRYCPVKLAEGKRVGRQQFTTLPVGPQLQALSRSLEGSRNLSYLHRTCEKIIAQSEPGCPLASYRDLASGSLILEAVSRQTIREHDIVLMFSIDGAQLYQNKQSDCWMYLWVVVSLAPDRRYKKFEVIPGGVIPGPNHPQDLDSFLVTGFYHVSALMNDGLRCYNAYLNACVVSYPFVSAGLADGPAMALVKGSVGHHGVFGCRSDCALPGRHKPGCPHYYPALLKPDDYHVAECEHDDVSLSSIGPPSVQRYEENLAWLLSAQNETQYKAIRKATGISKPSIFSGLSRTFPIPLGFPLDLMHLADLNWGDLLLGIWRGTIKGATQSDPKASRHAVLQGEVWINHGKLVGHAQHYLPGFLDRPPRDIAEKISSGYKAVEWHTYLYGYTVSMLRKLLPRDAWLHLCKHVKGVRLMYQEDITHEDVVLSKTLLTEGTLDFEVVYCERDPDRLHLVRPCISKMSHALFRIERVTVFDFVGARLQCNQCLSIPYKIRSLLQGRIHRGIIEQLSNEGGHDWKTL